MSALRILIADDHALIGDSLELHLKAVWPDVEVKKVLDFGQAETIAHGAEPLDLILLDLHMPGMDGLAGLARMRALRPAARVAVVSGEATLETARAVMDAGADGFIPKTAGAGVIVHAAQRMLAGEKFQAPEIYLRPAEVPEAQRSHAEGLTSLTAREIEVLRHLVNGLPNKEIGRNLGIEIVTVSLHLKNIYRKLGVANRTQAAKRGLEAGLGGALPPPSR